MPLFTAEAVKVTLVPVQIVLALAVILTAGVTVALTVTLVLAVAVQPPGCVRVAVYVVVPIGGVTVMELTVLPVLHTILPFGVVCAMIGAYLNCIPAT